MVTPPTSHAMWAQPHDFIHLQFRIPIKNPEELIKLYKRGLSLSDVAAQSGAPKSSIRRILIKNQIPLRCFAKENSTQASFRSSKRGAKPSYGFWYIEGKLVRHPKEYLILLQIIKRWKNGQSANSIATELNVKKTPSPMGKRWSWNSVTNIIHRIKNGQLFQQGEHYELR